MAGHSPGAHGIIGIIGDFSLGSRGVNTELVRTFRGSRRCTRATVGSVPGKENGTRGTGFAFVCGASGRGHACALGIGRDKDMDVAIVVDPVGSKRRINSIILSPRC